MNILIFGAGSYIGEHYRESLEKHGHRVVMVDAITVKPNEIDFSSIDTVINVAGIAHVKITPDMEDLFYRVNTNLAIDLCKEAKERGVKHYIYMSSMNVYGDTTKCIISRDQENPQSFYGRSKFLADEGIHALSSDSFIVASVRPPVVYGKGCKGNFVLLTKLAKYLFVFPYYENHKSMIYIDNLCAFMCELVENQDGGYFHPQNSQHTSIVEVIKEVRKAMGKKTMVLPGFGWAIKLLMKFSHKAERAFADDYYSLEFSRYRENTYCQVDFNESIIRSI